MEAKSSIVERWREEWDTWPDDFLDNEIAKMEKDHERIRHEIERGAGKLQERHLEVSVNWLGALQEYKETRNEKIHSSSV
jgi:hypothetical protein